MATTMTMAMPTARWAAAQRDMMTTTMAMGNIDDDKDGDGATGNEVNDDGNGATRYNGNNDDNGNDNDGDGATKG